VRLTKHSDYALRVLVYLAASEGRQASSEAVSEAYGISANHLVKVIGTLGKAGFLTIKRGRTGGFVLARDPAEIRIGDVIEATEPDFAFVECLEPGNRACALTGACGLVSPLQAAREAFVAALNEYTLADVVGARAPRYRKLLMLSRPPRSA
jgi:Rrf2 family transcriptional regulator, nitric oxide-sensitive transcriptional repressor